MRLTLLFSVLFLTYLHTFSQNSQGPFSPGSTTTGQCSFSYSSTDGYVNPGNVFASDDAHATFSYCACCDKNTNCMRLTDFGFSIPYNKIITGITVEIEKSATGNVIDNGLKLLKNGVEVGNDLGDHTTGWPGSDSYVTYGGCSNLWGTTWTPAEINNSNFGLFFASQDISCAGIVTSDIDHIRVTVCYATQTSLPQAASIAVIKTYPNPANDVITIENSLNTSSIVECFDILGNKHKLNFDKLDAKATKVNISSLAYGVYFLKFSFDDQSNKVVKFTKE